MSDDTPHPDAGAVALGVFVLLLIVAGSAISATTTFTATSGVTFQTDSGLTVTLEDTQQIQSGNPFTADGITINGSTITSNGGGTARLDALPQRTGNNFTNLSIVDSGSGRLEVTTPGVRAVGLAPNESASSLRVRNAINLTDTSDRVELVVSSTSQTAIVANGAGLDKGVVAVDADTGAALDAGVKQADGTLVFQIPSGTHDIAFQRGPSTLFIFDETNPSNLVKNQTGLRVRFIRTDADDLIKEFNVSDGKISLANISLPADSRLVVTVANSDKFVYRRIPIQSLIQQQEIYLLPTSNVSVSKVEFTLNDRTGRFANPLIRIKKPIRKDFDEDGDNETRYQTVVGDTFGTGSITVRLQQEQRYRIVLINQQGERRVLGSFTPLQDGQREELTVSQVALNPEVAETGVGFDAKLVQIDNTTRVTRFVYTDPQNKTSELSYEIIRVDTDPNETVTSSTISETLGRTVVTQPVTTNKSATFVVQFEYLRNGELRQRSIRLGGIRGFNLPGDPQVFQLLSWVGIAAITGAVVIRSPRAAAVVAAVLTTATTALGLTSVAPVELAVGTMIAILLFVSRGVGQ